MKYKNFVLAIIAIVLLVFILSCSHSVYAPNDPPPADNSDSQPDGIIGYTPEEILQSDYTDLEANLMALWYCNKLVPDIEIYNRFYDGITKLRAEYGDSISEVAIPFTTAWSPGQLLIVLNDSAHEAYENGDYTAWDYLNERLFLEKIREPLHPEWLKMYKLTFKSNLNPNILKSYYDTLPGVLSTYTNGYIGDWPCTYPWILNDTLTFLVRDAWEDCPSGCINSHFFYFKETADGFDLIGSWLLWEEPEPDWWTEAKIAYQIYRYGWPD
jgi:hypothetical protein